MGQGVFTASADMQVSACREWEANLAEGREGISVPRTFYTRYGKRVLDLILGILALVLTGPIILAAWVLVRATSKGPGFFCQDRVGENGKFFKCYKLRSMYIDQDERLDPDAREQEKDGVLVKMEEDPRVTKIGKIIRRTSIDELPQIFNVINGTLSMVGPRPLVPHMLGPWPNAAAVRNQVKPGISGLWQITSRVNNISLACMIEDDLEYIKTVSLWMDFRILLNTPAAVVKGEGAH